VILKDWLRERQKALWRLPVLLVAAVLGLGSANLADAAAGLPRTADRANVPTLSIPRLLGRPPVSRDAVVKPFSGGTLEPATAADHPLIRIPNRSEAAVRYQTQWERMTMVENPQSAAPLTGHGRAVKLVFSYNGEGVRLVSQNQVDMVVPLSDSLNGYQGQHGSWCELNDTEGRTLFRRRLHNPIQRYVEAPSDDPGHPLTRRPVDRLEGMFIVLVPDLQQANTVAIWDSPPQPGDAFSAGAATSDAFLPAQEIARFPIEKRSSAEDSNP